MTQHTGKTVSEAEARKLEQAIRDIMDAYRCTFEEAYRRYMKRQDK